MADPTDTSADGQAPEQPAPAASRVRVVSALGAHGTVAPGDVQRALADGFRLETPEEQRKAALQAKYGGLGGEAESALAGAARSYTFGLSDLALTKSGLVAPETLKNLSEANPAADIAGQAAGVFIPGLGLLGKGAKAVQAGGEALLGTGVVGRVLSKAAGGAFEGGFYGAGSALSESVLGDKQLTSEKLTASVGLGALMGGGLSGTGGLLAEGARPLARKLLPALGDIQGAVQAEAERRAVKAAGAIKGDIRAYSREEVQQLGRDLLDAGLISPGASLEDVLAKAKAGVEEHGQKIGDVLKQADQLSGGSFDFNKVLERINEDLGQKVKGNPISEKDLESVMGQLEGASDKMPFERANAIKTRLQAGLFNKLEPGPKQALAEQVAGILNDEIETQLKDAAPDLVDQFGEAKRLYGVHKEAERFAERGLQRQLGNRFFSLTDQGLGAAAGLLTGGPVGLATGFAGAVANKVLRERGPALAATALDALAKSPVFARVAEAFQGFVESSLAKEPAIFGRFGDMLKQASARGADELLLTHGVLSESDPQYRDTMLASGLDYGEQGSATTRRALTLSAIKAQLAKQDERAQGAVDDFLSGKQGKRVSPAPFAEALGLSGGDFVQQTNALRKLAQDPAGLVDRISQALGPLTQDAPQLASSMSETATRAVGFLAQKAPARQDGLDDVPALRRPWAPSDADRARFERYATVVANPSSIYESIRAGAVTREAVEALQSVYPAFYADLQKQALERLMSHDKPLTYQQRLALSMLAPVEPGATPQAIAANQAMIAATPMQQKMAPKPKPGTPGATIASASELIEAKAQR